MKRVYFTILFIGMFFFVFGLGRCFAKPLEVGMLHFPPYYEIKGTDQVEGIFVDFLKKVMDEADIEYTFKGYPPRRLYQNVASGKTDIWMGTTDVKAYEGKVEVSPERIVNIYLRAYSVGDTPVAKSPADLKGKSVITIHGYNYAGFIKFLKAPDNNIQINDTPTHKQALKMLQKGRADYLIDYKMPLENTLDKMSAIEDLKFGDLKEIGIYINVSKKTPNTSEVMDNIMDAYQTLQEKGELDFN